MPSADPSRGLRARAQEVDSAGEHDERRHARQTNHAELRPATALGPQDG